MQRSSPSALPTGSHGGSPAVCFIPVFHLVLTLGGERWCCFHNSGHDNRRYPQRISIPGRDHSNHRISNKAKIPWTLSPSPAGCCVMHFSFILFLSLLLTYQTDCHCARFIEGEASTPALGTCCRGHSSRLLSKPTVSKFYDEIACHSQNHVMYKDALLWVSSNQQNRGASETGAPDRRCFSHRKFLRVIQGFWLVVWPKTYGCKTQTPSGICILAELWHFQPQEVPLFALTLCIWYTLQRALFA